MPTDGENRLILHNENEKKNKLSPDWKVGFPRKA